MKKTITILAIVSVALMTLISCGSDDEPAPSEKRQTKFNYTLDNIPIKFEASGSSLTGTNNDVIHIYDEHNNVEKDIFDFYFKEQIATGSYSITNNSTTNDSFYFNCQRSLLILKPLSLTMNISYNNVNDGKTVGTFSGTMRDLTTNSTHNISNGHFTIYSD